MRNEIQDIRPILPENDRQFWQRYTIAEKFFYLILCHLLKRHAGEGGRVTCHDTVVKNGIPPFRSFGISLRICKNARRKLRDGGLIAFRHVYGPKGHRIGTEYGLPAAIYRESPKAIHALILNKRMAELSTPASIPHGSTLISPSF